MPASHRRSLVLAALSFAVAAFAAVGALSTPEDSIGLRTRGSVGSPTNDGTFLPGTAPTTVAPPSSTTEPSTATTTVAPSTTATTVTVTEPADPSAQLGGAFGVLVDASGAPVAGFCIDGRPTDDQGRFQVEGLVPGDQVLGGDALPGTGCPVTGVPSFPIEVRILPGEWIGPITLVLL